MSAFSQKGTHGTGPTGANSVQGNRGGKGKEEGCSFLADFQLSTKKIARRNFPFLKFEFLFPFFLLFAFSRSVRVSKNIFLYLSLSLLLPVRIKEQWSTWKKLCSRQNGRVIRSVEIGIKRREVKRTSVNWLVVPVVWYPEYLIHSRKRY